MGEGSGRWILGGAYDDALTGLIASVNSATSIRACGPIGALDPKMAVNDIACAECRDRAVDDDDIDIAFESICFHSDSPGSLGLAQAIRGAPLRQGIRIAPAAEIVARSRNPEGDVT